MKICKTEKSILSTLFLTLICMISCIGLSACSFGNGGKLTNENGFVVEGGNFAEGSVIEARVIDSTSNEYEETLTIIASESYDNTKPVYVFEISVKKDNVKVQPNGKVKVSVPVSTDLTGYDVLHIKSDGKIERLTVTYKNGIASFETNSFSKFVFVKKATPVDSGDDDTTTKYTINSIARRIAYIGISDGGAVLDASGEHITYVEKQLAEGTEYTLQSLCYPDYSFVGWYEASEREEATEDTFLSSETTYTFTVTKNLNICALYAHKTDAVKFKLVADSAGFSYRDGEPTITLVSSNESADKPNHEGAYILAELGDGSWKDYGSYSSPNSNLNVDLGGLDYSKVGTYTITYSYKRNANIKATLTVQVVDSAHTLNVEGDNNFYFYYNAGGYANSLSKVLPTGKLVTLSAMPESGYAFTGWYAGENLISNDLVYCFEMPNSDVTLQGRYTAGSIKLDISVGYYSEGELVDDFGNAYVWANETKYFKSGEQVSFTVREQGSYEFLGWYDVTGGKSDLITTNEKIDLTLTESKSIKAKFREKVKSIEIDSTTLSNEGFVDGKIGFAIGDAEIDYKNFTVKAKGVAGSDMTLSASDYIIDDSLLNLKTVGTYIITYTYKFDTNIKTQIQIDVVNPASKQFTFEQGCSYLDHEYDGKATFISLKDVKFNGVALYNFKSTSKIWEKLSYKWIDKTTGLEVDTEGVDITINGNIVKDFGPENHKRTIGNEFGGPIKAGAYRFELMYDGETVISQDSTISTQIYKKITSVDEFKTNEGSTWVNFELYYYTIIGYANGKYYVMQMPSIGTDNTEVEAREISVDSNGNAVVGGGNDFAFVYVKYFAHDSINRMEFLTGYYGSYIDYSSDSTSDGTMFGTPYIYRTGHTYVSDGKMCRDYGNKSNYGMSTEFGQNGAVTIHANNGSDNGKLRLVKDGDKYVFTSAPADADSRESFDIFIYRTIIEDDIQESNK